MPPIYKGTRIYSLIMKYNTTDFSISNRTKSIWNITFSLDDRSSIYISRSADKIASSKGMNKLVAFPFYMSKTIIMKNL